MKSLSTWANVNDGSNTQFWLTNVTSDKYFFTLPSTILSIMFSGLPDALSWDIYISLLSSSPTEQPLQFGNSSRIFSKASLNKS